MYYTIVVQTSIAIPQYKKFNAILFASVLNVGESGTERIFIILARNNENIGKTQPLANAKIIPI